MWNKVVADDGWPNTIHGCKEDEKKRRLDKDKKWDFHYLLMVVSRKVCCLCVMWNKVVADDGWPNTIHGCKEDEKKRRLDKDKKWDSKEKEGSLFGRK